MRTTQPHSYEIRIFGARPVHPDDYQLAASAIDRAKRELLGQGPHATGYVVDKRSKETIWTGFVADDGTLVESQPRPLPE
jgi:hypothetical protein